MIPDFNHLVGFYMVSFSFGKNKKIENKHDKNKKIQKDEIEFRQLEKYDLIF